jgi:hypothetical protein
MESMVGQAQLSFAAVRNRPEDRVWYVPLFRIHLFSSAPHSCEKSQLRIKDEVHPAVHKTGRRGLWLRAVDGRQHVPPARHTRLAHVGESRGVLRAS